MCFKKQTNKQKRLQWHGALYDSPVQTQQWHCSVGVQLRLACFILEVLNNFPSPWMFSNDLVIWKCVQNCFITFVFSIYIYSYDKEELVDVFYSLFWRSLQLQTLLHCLFPEPTCTKDKGLDHSTLWRHTTSNFIKSNESVIVKGNQLSQVAQTKMLAGWWLGSLTLKESLACCDSQRWQ